MSTLNIRQKIYRPQPASPSHYDLALRQCISLLYHRIWPKYSKDLIFWGREGHLNQVLTFEIDPDFLKLASLKPVDGDPIWVHNNPVNSKQLPLIHFIEKIHAQQMLTGFHG